MGVAVPEGRGGEEDEDRVAQLPSHRGQPGRRSGDHPIRVMARGQLLRAWPGVSTSRSADVATRRSVNACRSLPIAPSRLRRVGELGEQRLLGWSSTAQGVEPDTANFEIEFAAHQPMYPMAIDEIGPAADGDHAEFRRAAQEDDRASVGWAEGYEQRAACGRPLDAGDRMSDDDCRLADLLSATLITARLPQPRPATRDPRLPRAA
jgi:hypothetical protein